MTKEFDSNEYLNRKLVMSALLGKEGKSIGTQFVPFVNAKQIMLKGSRSPFCSRKLARTQNSAFTQEKIALLNFYFGYSLREMYFEASVKEMRGVVAGHGCPQDQCLKPHCGSSCGWTCPCLSSKYILKSNISGRKEAQFCSHQYGFSVATGFFFPQFLRNRKVLNSEE